MSTINGIALVTILFLASCTSKEVSRLRHENDSLRQQIERRNDMLIAMSEVNSIADSILNKHGLGTAPEYQRYMDRIEFLHRSLMLSENENTEINKDLRKTREEALAYNMMVIALQDEVTIREGEISDHQKT